MALHLLTRDYLTNQMQDVRTLLENIKFSHDNDGHVDTFIIIIMERLHRHHHVSLGENHHIHPHHHES